MRNFVVAAIVLAGCAGKHVRETDPGLEVEVSEATVAHGAYVVGALAYCGLCHNGYPGGGVQNGFDTTVSVLGGGNVFEHPDKPDKFQLYVPNITQDPESGVGRWTDDELIRGIREGIRPDGSRMLPVMPYGYFQHMSDRDVRAVVAYLRTVPPAEPVLPPQDHKLPFPIKPVLMAASRPSPVDVVPEPDRGDPVAYGGYLARVGHCGECHSPGLGSLAGPGGKKDLGGSGMALPEYFGHYPAPNLSVLGDRDAGDILAALRGGRRLDGEPMLPPMSMVSDALRGWTDEDLSALVAYLQSLEPVRTREVPREPNEKGFEWLAERERFLVERDQEALAAQGDGP